MSVLNYLQNQFCNGPLARTVIICWCFSLTASPYPSDFCIQSSRKPVWWIWGVYCLQKCRYSDNLPIIWHRKGFPNCKMTALVSLLEGSVLTSSSLATPDPPSPWQMFHTGWRLHQTALIFIPWKRSVGLLKCYCIYYRTTWKVSC